LFLGGFTSLFFRRIYLPVFRRVYLPVLGGFYLPVLGVLFLLASAGGSSILPYLSGKYKQIMLFLKSSLKKALALPGARP